MKRNKRTLMVAFFTILIATTIGYTLIDTDTPKTKEVSYITFREMVKDKQVVSAEYAYKKDMFTFVDKKGKDYITGNPQTETFKEYLLKNKIKVTSPFELPDNLTSWGMLLATIASFGLILKFLRPNTKAKQEVTKIPNVALKDIACASSIKKEVKMIIDYLKNPALYEQKKAKFPTGILFYGPPGTGKTMLAKAIAHESKCKFFAMSGSDFIEMYAGRGAARVRELFKEARKNTPCIIFIDELDAIGRKRGHDSNGEENQTINALLSELDGFSSKGNIMVMAATNRIEELDPALIRSGRFGKHIKVPLPMTKEERMKIINIHKIKDAYDESVDFNQLSKITIGCSGADIADILNNALLISVMDGKEKVDKESLEKAFNQHLFEGHQNDKSTTRNLKELKLVAYHEAGHALINKKLCGLNVSSVSIISTTTGAGGYTVSTPEEDTHIYTKEELIHRVQSLYAGRAAETVKGLSLSTGASDDIKRATEILSALFQEYAMGDDGVVNLSVLYHEGGVNEKVVDQIKKLSLECYEKTIALLKKNETTLDKVAEELLEKETIDEMDINRILDNCDWQD